LKKDERVDEVKIMKKFKHHPNIVEFISVENFNGDNYITMEYLEIGDLESYLSKTKKFETR